MEMAMAFAKDALEAGSGVAKWKLMIKITSAAAIKWTPTEIARLWLKRGMFQPGGAWLWVPACALCGTPASLLINEIL